MYRQNKTMNYINCLLCSMKHKYDIFMSPSTDSCKIKNNWYCLKLTDNCKWLSHISLVCWWYFCCCNFPQFPRESFWLRNVFASSNYPLSEDGQKSLLAFTHLSLVNSCPRSAPIFNEIRNHTNEFKARVLVWWSGPRKYQSFLHVPENIKLLKMTPYTLDISNLNCLP